MKLSNLRVGIRLGAGFGTILIFLIAVITIGMVNMGHLQDRMVEIGHVNAVEAELAASMRGNMLNRMIILRNLALLSDMSEMRPEADRLKELGAKYAETEVELNKMFADFNGTDFEKTLMAKIKETDTAALPVMTKAAELGLANKADQATRVLMGELHPMQVKWQGQLTELVDFQHKSNTEAMAAVEKAYANARLLMFALGGIALLCGALMGFFITRSLLRQLGGEPAYAQEIARRVADGDVSTLIQVRAGDSASLVATMKTCASRTRWTSVRPT
ncbi:MAG: MCP four helix bundle domain-containing protein [Betaproteobacteria bacterium]|nr:MCP four helix bundle domain-containing protein [Betaproteobacteria bacterium]